MPELDYKYTTLPFASMQEAEVWAREHQCKLISFCGYGSRQVFEVRDLGGRSTGRYGMWVPMTKETKGA